MPNYKHVTIKNNFLFLVLLGTTMFSYGQNSQPSASQRKLLTELIAQYSRARETGDTILLNNILTKNVDQLVSTGEWRSGIKAAMEGMKNSSATNPGSRTLIVDKIRMITPVCAIVDCRYEIANANGNSRKMWSSFIVVADKNAWKITAIRNMLPASR